MHGAVRVIRDTRGRGLGEVQRLGSREVDARRFDDPFLRRSFSTVASAERWVRSVRRAAPRVQHADMSRPGRTGRIEWGIWSVRSKRWMHDPNVAPVNMQPARYPSRRAAEEAADKLWRAYNPDERFQVLPF